MHLLQAVIAAAAKDVVPWPWPLAPIFLAVLLGIAALVLYNVYKHVIRGDE